MSDKLTLRELFAIFDRSEAETRYMACVDSTEYLNIVTYLVGRANAR